MHLSSSPGSAPDDAARGAIEAPGIVARMANVMCEQAGSFHTCTAETLSEAGFSRSEIELYGPDARAKAFSRFVRDDAPVYDRVARVRVARETVLGTMPNMQAIVTHLMHRGFSKTELDDILPEVMTQVGGRIAAEGGAA